METNDKNREDIKRQLDVTPNGPTGGATDTGKGIDTSYETDGMGGAGGTLKTGNLGAGDMTMPTLNAGDTDTGVDSDGNRQGEDLDNASGVAVNESDLDRGGMGNTDDIIVGGAMAGSITTGTSGGAGSTGATGGTFDDDMALGDIDNAGTGVGSKEGRLGAGASGDTGNARMGGMENLDAGSSTDSFEDDSKEDVWQSNRGRDKGDDTGTVGNP